jgi:glycosyltransferase involved in cell wall biosynthesis
MNASPKVSVFIAAYNHARYLPACLDSLLAQTYTDFEIVVVDDGSKDGSLDVLLDYQRRFPDKVRCISHPGHANKGVSATSNLAIRLSRGEYLAWTGSDDQWYPDKLRQQVALLEQDARLGLVYSYADFIDGDSRPLPGRAGTDITHDPDPVTRILQFCHVPAMTAVFRRACLDEVGCFDEGLVYSDWDLMIRVFARWKVGFNDQALAQYRMHTHNLSKKIDPRVDLRRIIAMYRSLEQKWSAIGGALNEPRHRAMFDLQMAFHLFCDEQWDEAVTYLQNAFAHDPSLCENTEFVNAWLEQWKPPFYTVQHPHFGYWVIAHLPAQVSHACKAELLRLQADNDETQDFYVQRGVEHGQKAERAPDMDGIFEDLPSALPRPAEWKAGVLQKVYPVLLFESYAAGERAKARHYWKKMVRLDPRWLRNRGVLSIGLKMWLGGAGSTGGKTPSEASEA